MGIDKLKKAEDFESFFVLYETALIMRVSEHIKRLTVERTAEILGKSEILIKKYLYQSQRFSIKWSLKVLKKLEEVKK